MSKVYMAGIYARLSVDLDDRKRESIENQIAVAKRFTDSQKDMKIVDIYTDIGKSGTTFKRQGFERMMEDVRNKKINCILVKDLSRFGRNYIETGNYLEKIFPFLQVRFVSIIDDFDTLHILEGREGLCIHLKNLMNEMYAKDIAKKVKSSKQVQKQSGNYMGSIAPYGYQIETNNNRRFLRTDKTAEVVRNIYDKFLEGYSYKGIIKWLYEKKILRPEIYEKTGQMYAKKEEFLPWAKQSIHYILTNPVYMGCICSEKIIEEDTFFRVKEILENRYSKETKNTKPHRIYSKEMELHSEKELATLRKKTEQMIQKNSQWYYQYRMGSMEEEIFLRKKREANLQQDMYRRKVDEIEKRRKKE